MLLIFFTWVYLFFVFSIQGEWINRFLFKGKLRSIGEPVLVGIVFQAILASFLAFFYRIHVEYFCVNTLFSLVLLFVYKDAWLKRLKIILQWDSFCIGLFLVMTALSLSRSALLPFILDNESYYIQTIRWLNEYGWVKGVANIHVFLGHAGGWHALQAAFNFHFLAGYFNDINGFLMVAMALLWLEKISVLRRNADYSTHRWLFFLPVFSVLWFQFVDSPSADLPLFLITPVIIYHFLNRSEQGDILSIILSVFLVFIKFSIAPVLLLSFFFLSKKNWKAAVCVSLFLGILYLSKNIWTSGCPLAPYTGFSIPLPWTIPAGLTIVLEGDAFNFRSFGSNGVADIGIFIVIIAVYITYCLSVLKKKEQYPIVLLFTLQLLLVGLTNAQFRFVLPAFFYPAAYLMSRIRIPVKGLTAIISFFISLVAIPIFIPLDYSLLAKNSALLNTDAFHADNLLKPSGISKYPAMTFEKVSCTNFEFYNPADSSRFIFLTGNGPLPCVKTDYLRYMYRRTQHLPALIGKELKDGFQSVPVDKK